MELFKQDMDEGRAEWGNNWRLEERGGGAFGSEPILYWMEGLGIFISFFLLDLFHFIFLSSFYWGLLRAHLVLEGGEIELQCR